MTSTATQPHDTFQAVNPATGETLPGLFTEATASDVAQAGDRAAAAFQTYRRQSGRQKADFLDRIAQEIDGLGDELLQRAHAESGLPLARLTGERGRTTGQLRLFAAYLREGSWVDARIDPALPDRQPLPRPDLRQMLRPLGPVGVFGASNFPLAFSVAGGDTASALAAGCPVVVKAHPAHPGTSALVGQAIERAVASCGLPAGTFALVQGRTTAVGMAIVQHPALKAVGFTGSLRGGKALFDAAAARPEPIPVYAEMGSTNPVFFLPDALKANGAALAGAYVASVTLGVGQFCTNPGLAMLIQSPEADAFRQQAQAAIRQSSPAAMLTQAIQQNFARGITKLTDELNVGLLAQATAVDGFAHGTPTLLTTPAAALLANPAIAEEVFGPGSILVEADNRAQLMTVAQRLEGHLTATVYSTVDELPQYADLLDVLEQKVGRLIINSFPTGVEVSHAMHHGGPYPATTDSRSTSVGTNAIRRFARPVCYQGFPQALLPDELKDTNPLASGGWLMVTSVNKAFDTTDTMNWNAELYAKKHAFVYEYGANLIELLNPTAGELILDLGCGSGVLTQQIAGRGATVIGLDSSPAMIERAIQQFPALDFRLGDATTFALPERVDAIFSNAVLHWVTECDQAVERMSQHLKPGGRLVVELGGQDNIRQLTEAISRQLGRRGYQRHAVWWYFPSVGEYSSLLEKHGFRVRLAQHYDRDTRLADPETGLTDWIEQFGGNFFTDVPDADRTAVLAAVTADLRPALFRNGCWYADYKRLRMVAERL